MLKFVIKRILQMPVMLLLITFFLFLVINISPTDPAVALLPSDFTQEDIDRIHEEYGFNDPLVVQYVSWFTKAIQGDLGISYQTKMDIWQEAVYIRLPVSAKVGIVTLAFSVVLGIPLGVISAVNQYNVIDLTINLTSKTLSGVPGFIYAVIFTLIFSVNLGWLPSYGLTTPLHWVLPVVSSFIAGMGGICRQTRSSMLECIRQDYITTARSKGVPENSILFKEALRNAMLPIITMVGGQVAMVIGGNIIIESVFAIPGLGTYVLTAINYMDTPVIMGTSCILAVFFMVVMLFVDLSYGVIDPRTRAAFISPAKKKKVAPKEVPA